MNQKSVLIVDDDAAIAEAIRRAVLPRSQRQKVFTCAESALREVLASPNQWDIVITDYRMPGMTGVEFAQRLRAAGFRGRIVLISGEMAQVAPLQEGLFDAALEKPLSLRALLAALF